MKPPAPSRRRGLSLIEIVITLSIAAILAGVALPRLNRSLARQRLDAAERRVVADIRLARNEARSTSSGTGVFFRPSADRYALLNVHGRNDVVALDDDPYCVELYAAAFGDDTTLDFDGFGVPGASGSVYLHGAGEFRIITVTAAGELSTTRAASLAAEPPQPPEIVPEALQ